MKMQTTGKKSVYGIIGIVAVFLIGGMIGFIINGSNRINHSTMSKSDCNNIANRIMNAARDNRPDLIEQLNKVYSENCLDREFEQPKPQPKIEEKKTQKKTCEVIEDLLKERLADEHTNNWESHEANANVYENLIKTGCPENQGKYIEQRAHELKIADALRIDDAQIDKDAPTCSQIEGLLLDRLHGWDMRSPDSRVERAKIYANLSERGCPENSEKYKNLAKQEIDIARALTDDDVEHNQRKSVEIVETYKRLQMQAEAAKMIEKAKKLTNPAIDFIIELEKILEE